MIWMLPYARDNCSTAARVMAAVLPWPPSNTVCCLQEATSNLCSFTEYTSNGVQAWATGIATKFSAKNITENKPYKD